VRSLLALALALSAIGCERAASGSPEMASAGRTNAVSAAAGPTAERRFGGASTVEGDPVDVAQVLAAPQRYLNQNVKCAGTVARVCEAAGCWLELRAAQGEGGAQGLRVPMAGHSFFVPRDVVGRPAVVEGVLSARELNAAELAHLTGEGLSATGPLSLAATSVVVR
jgi:Domain of unknown function (DUF4920)